MKDIIEFHERLLYPTVRVRHTKAGGSGTVVYSQRVQDHAETYILTNHHVVDDLITIKDEWDAYLKRNVKREIREVAKVDFFRYNQTSYKIGEEQIDADIVAWVQDQDLALLRLRDNERVFPHVATLAPIDVSRNLRLFEPVWAVGAALLHPPYPTRGYISSVADEIDNYAYQMSSAAITFGNSGGAVYLEETGQWIGIPSRVAIQGWGDVANHMGFFVPAWRVYEWLAKEDYNFIFDAAHTPQCCAARREERKRRAERAIEALRQGVIEESDAEAVS